MIMADQQVVLKNPTGEIVARRKPKKVSLEEDEFTDAMRKIIRRDYFPDIEKHEAQLAYIEATESNDPVKLREISERYATDLVQTPSAQTPSAWVRGNKRESTDSTSMPPPPPMKILKPEESKTLDVFLNKYNSEDDSSFDEIMEKEDIRRREKYAWMYERESIANKPAITSGRDTTLAITDGKDIGRSVDNHGDIKMWKYTAKNTLMYIPDGVEFSPAELIKRGKGKEIKCNNTRLSRDFLKQMAETGTPDEQTTGVDRQKQLMKEKIGVDGKQMGVSESPNVQGYGFVATPQINPGVDASPLMTWGTIDGTPLHIDGDITSTPGQVFKIPKESLRDNIGIKLASEASKSQREKKKAAMAQATSALLGASPRLRSPIVSDKLRLLSPAARKLIKQNSSSGTLRGDRSLRSSYSATPTRSATPGHTPKHIQRGGTPKTPSLTDNLLNLK